MGHKNREEIAQRLFGHKPGPFAESVRILADEVKDRETAAGSYDGGARTTAPAKASTSARMNFALRAKAAGERVNDEGEVI